MIQSMTGFGKSITQLPSKKVTVEIKSLNSKNLDVNARIPSQYREKELQLRNTISKSLTRGKVDFSLYVEVTGEETTASVNRGVVKNYMQQLKSIVDGDETELLKMAVRMPDAVTTEREKKEEGEALEKEWKLRGNNIEALLQEVLRIDPERVDAVKERLRKGIADLKENVDENRFEQELVYYIEKFDITEEKVRLENHLAYFNESINSPDSNGRKLGFISQEMGREINTIGSKSNYAPMQQLVVQMKDELEKIKEQLLNVL